MIQVLCPSESLSLDCSLIVVASLIPFESFLRGLLHEAYCNNSILSVNEPPPSLGHFSTYDRLYFFY